MAAVYSERYGYEIQFPPTLQAKLVELYRNDNDGWDELHSHIHHIFPYIDTFGTDILTTWGAIEDKEVAQRFDKEVQKAIRTWLRNYNAKKGEAK